MTEVLERAAAPARAPDVDAFGKEVEAAQAELAQGISKAGLRGDPYAVVLSALSEALGLFPAFLGRMDQLSERTRLPLDPAALERLERAAAKGAERRAAELARTHARRTVLRYVGLLLLCMGLAGGGGFLWGRMSAERAVERTEQRLAAALQDGAEAAEGWAILMENNDLRRALDLCTGTRSYADPSGRKVCLLPLYVEAPRRAAPAEERRR